MRHARILVVNSGSSSIKFSVFESHADGSLKASARGQVASIGPQARIEIFDAAGCKLRDESIVGRTHHAGIAAIHQWLASESGGKARFDGVGHRVVHGGADYSEPVLLNDRVMEALDALVPLAPLHQPPALAAIRAVKAVALEVPQVACFDTAFHRTQPRIAQLFGLPREFTTKGIRRYGFHGLSYEYIAAALPELAPDSRRDRLVVAHLGNGASLCAIQNGRSIATTMGFTPLDGLLMGTRAGTLDPGVVLYLMQHEGLDARAIERLLYERSGLLGVSGVSGDMRALLASAEPAAKEAVDLFVYRIGRELGSLAAALGGLEALVFTGGIGENAAEIRARVCRDASWLGIRLDEEANSAGGPRISAPGSGVAAWVLPTDENLMIARHTRKVLGKANAGG